MLSLRHGTPETYFQSRCEEILNLSCDNDIFRKLAARMLPQLKAEAESSGDPAFMAEYHKAISNYYFFTQQFDKVFKPNDLCLQFYLENRPGSVWHITALWSIRFWALKLSGDFRLMSEQLRVPLRRAREHGDLNAIRSLAEAKCTDPLRTGDVEKARLELRTIRDELPNTRNYSVSHCNADFADSMINLYEGNFQHVADLLEASERKSKRSEINQIQLIRGMRAHYMASALCHLIRDGSSDKVLLVSKLLKLMKQMKKEKTDYALGLHYVISGFLYLDGGEAALAKEQFLRGLEHYELSGAGASVRSLKHQLSKSSLAVSEQWGKESQAYAAGQGIHDFDRFSAIFSPPLS